MPPLFKDSILSGAPPVPVVPVPFVKKVSAIASWELARARVCAVASDSVPSLVDARFWCSYAEDAGGACWQRDMSPCCMVKCLCGAVV